MSRELAQEGGKGALMVRESSTEVHVQGHAKKMQGACGTFVNDSVENVSPKCFRFRATAYRCLHVTGPRDKSCSHCYLVLLWESYRKEGINVNGT